MRDMAPYSILLVSSLLIELRFSSYFNAGPKQ